MHPQTSAGFKQHDREPPWWRRSSNENIFRVTGSLFGEFTGHRWISLTQRPEMRSFGVFFDLRLKKRLKKQPRHWWFETPSRSPWRHCNPAVSRRYSMSSSEACDVSRKFHKHDHFDERAFAVCRPLPWDCLPKNLGHAMKLKNFQVKLQA